jgi:phage terminase large subunit-like protein
VSTALESLTASLGRSRPDPLAAAISRFGDEWLDAAEDARGYDWRGEIARPSQVAPEGEWRTWLILAGRGFGKTRTGAEWVREEAEAGPGLRFALIAPTAADARDVMVEGESGILAISPPWFRPRYEPSKRRLTWPNGAMATLYSADEPERLRGPQHHRFWGDEPASWRYREAWDMLMFGLRLGDNPRGVVTGTPKPIALIRQLVADPTTVVTRGSTYENAANLPAAFLDAIIKRYEGTRLGRQELNAEILDDIEGALWTRAVIDAGRVAKAPDLVRVVVGVDPAVTATEESDETGIVVVGQGVDMQYYVLSDRTCRLSPDGWARRAVETFREFEADRIIGEVNNGGDLVEAVVGHAAKHLGVLHSYKSVRASRGKAVRAEPIAALYEQGRVHHVGSLAALEDQLCGWVPGAGDRSPDRMDALVWALSELATDAALPEWGWI